MSLPECEGVVRRALEEDLQDRGDITSEATVAPEALGAARIVARSAGVIAGLPVAEATFKQVDPSIHFQPEAQDGDAVEPGQTLAEIRGPARGILTGERTALNFLGHLSGIATATNRLVRAVEGTRAKILDTRKTTPGLRALEKYAVRMGGGTNHRIGLFDAVLIKDNHIAVVGGVEEAIRRARSSAGPGVSVEVEVESLEQLEEALQAGADIVLLDNMSLEMLRLAVQAVADRAQTEASGGITLENVRRVAETGVDLISAGWITHSAPNLDVALEFEVRGNGVIGDR